MTTRRPSNEVVVKWFKGLRPRTVRSPDPKPATAPFAAAAAHLGRNDSRQPSARSSLTLPLAATTFGTILLRLNRYSPIPLERRSQSYSPSSRRRPSARSGRWSRLSPAPRRSKSESPARFPRLQRTGVTSPPLRSKTGELFGVYRRKRHCRPGRSSRRCPPPAAGSLSSCRDPGRHETIALGADGR